MKKLKDLRTWIITQQEETMARQRDSQRTGNPHLATRESGAAHAYIRVIEQIDKALAPKKKEKK